MIRKFVDIYMNNLSYVEEQLHVMHGVDEYAQLVQLVIRTINKGITEDGGYGYGNDGYGNSCIDKLVYRCEISSGSYSGTNLYVITQKWSCKFYYIFVDYGSCSGCDALDSINGEKLEDRYKDYMQMCLHIAQGIKELEQELEQ